jgi:2-iminobutanoate/2-iminopropanoate deaminase
VRRVISTKNAPAAIGPYSQAIEANGTLYCSGQIALDPATAELNNESVEQETEQVLKNLGAVLSEAGYAYADVVKTTVFLADMNDYATVNEIYARYFSEAKPARAAVAVKTLPKNVRVEIDCIAVK